MTLASGNPLYDSAYTQALRDVAGNIVDGRLLAGQNWPQVWTRDSAYAIDLGAGLGRPDIAMATMRTKTMTAAQGEVWTQDRAGHFGHWPHLTDSIVGAAGAWATYLAGGDTGFLDWSLQVTRNTLARAEQEAFDASSGLFRGCASFMESNSAYPFRFRFNGRAVGRTKALSTNLLFFRGYRLAARMARQLGQDAGDFDERADRLRDAINRRLWMPAVGYYAYLEFEDGKQFARMEGLGEALAVLWGVADDAQAESVLKNTFITGHGIPCLWPRYVAWVFKFNDANYYHNGMVWPFVQAYWALAAASRGAHDVFGRELSHLAQSARRASTFHEFYRPLSGTPDGSPRQLWSAAGYLAMVHSGLFGMSFEPDAVRFSPVVPKGFSGPIRLTGFRYRAMTLDVEVRGPGNEVESCAIDGQPVADAKLPMGTTGEHRIELKLRFRARRSG